MSNSVRLADYVIEFLSKQKVRHIFMVPGGGVMYLNDALAKNKDIVFVPNHHEQASSIAAEAYSRIDEYLGVAMVTTGPGSTNAITGVAGAWIESVPMLVLSGQVKRADLIAESGVRQKGVQEVDIISMVTPVTKYAITVMEPTTIRYHLEKAVYLATSGRRGPVWITIPLDVQASIIEPDTLTPYIPPENQRTDLGQAVSTVVDLVNESQRPLLLAGHGVRLSRAEDNFKRLYEGLQIPVATTWNAMDLIPAAHELSIGRPGNVAQRAPNFAVQNCDLLLSIGARLDNIVCAYNPAKFARHARKVMVDVDQHELFKFNPPIDHAIEADAAAFIDALLAKLQVLKKIDRHQWLRCCWNWKAKYPPACSQQKSDENLISHYDLINVLSTELPEDILIVTGSSGLAIEVFYTHFQNKRGQRIFLTSGLGAMGYGLPAIIGAGLASGKPLIGIESDGSLLMNLQELLTIRQFNIPVRIFVLNNNGYASIRTTQRNYFEERYIGTGPESSLLLPDLVSLAQVIGIPGIRVEHMSELTEKVRLTLEQPGPFICDIKLIADEPLYPRCMTIQQPDGSLLSMPLEDMWPLLSLHELKENMLVPLDPASEIAVRS